MTVVIESLLGRALARNNAAVLSADLGRPNPRDVASVPWVADMERSWDVIRQEWDAFVTAGNRVPLIEDVLVESQGNSGSWRAALLVAKGRPAGPFVESFPGTIAALESIPGLRSALFSYMEPGCELPEHVGPNAGVLRYHLGVVCPPGSALDIDGTIVEYRERHSILFDDTVPHSAWNRSDSMRVTLFCELDRPLDGPLRLANSLVQSLIMLDSRYRGAVRRSFEWNRALNHRTVR